MNRFYVLLALSVAFALLGGGYRLGVLSEQGNAALATAEQLRQAFEQGRELGTVRDRIVTEYVDRVQVIEKRGATIVKEVPVYVSAAADRACAVPAGFVRLHDAAALGLQPPGGAGAADEAASGVALSAVAGTVAGNYTECHASAEQLRQLQAVVAEQQNIINGTKSP